MTRPRRAGTSATEKFRQERLATFRREWKILSATLAITTGLVAAVVFEHGWFRVGAAFLLGCYLTGLIVVWVTGLDARSLPWRWGALGEEWTAKELARLGSGWRIYHDLQDGRGNIDHIAVGPPGVFLIDSKNLRQPATVGADGLRAGSIRAGGPASRAAAARLKSRLEQEADVTVWVQAVLAVWGELKGGVQERDNVRYIPGAMIASALENQPVRLRNGNREHLIAALDRITTARS